MSKKKIKSNQWSSHARLIECIYKFNLLINVLIYNHTLNNFQSVNAKNKSKRGKIKDLGEKPAPPQIHLSKITVIKSKETRMVYLHMQIF